MREGKFRLYNKETIKKLEEIHATGRYATKNDLYQEVMKLGLENLHAKVFGKGKESLVENTREKDYEELMKSIAFAKMSVDELYVHTAMIKHLVTTMFNVQVSLLDGERVDRTLIETGALSILPKNLQEIENSMQAKHRKERQK